MVHTKSQLFLLCFLTLFFLTHYSPSIQSFTVLSFHLQTHKVTGTKCERRSLIWWTQFTKTLTPALLLSYPPPSFQKRLKNTLNSCLSWRDCSVLCKTARGMDTCEFGRKKKAGSLPGERLCTSRCRQRIWPWFKEEGHSSISSRDIVWATPSEVKGFLPRDIQGQKPGARINPGASWWNKHPPAVEK